ncbi:hypothetical protein OF83DRAFT_1179467 [Amylostereum chailletii]|nr:hypothetical protein OF83DRAFT_1179467 [Amylostereum chailletii]
MPALPAPPHHAHLRITRTRTSASLQCKCACAHAARAPARLTAPCTTATHACTTTRLPTCNMPASPLPSPPSTRTPRSHPPSPSPAPALAAAFNSPAPTPFNAPAPSPTSSMRPRSPPLQRDHLNARNAHARTPATWHRHGPTHPSASRLASVARVSREHVGLAYKDFDLATDVLTAFLNPPTSSSPPPCRSTVLSPPRGFKFDSVTKKCTNPVQDLWFWRHNQELVTPLDFQVAREVQIELDKAEEHRKELRCQQAAAFTRSLDVALPADKMPDKETKPSTASKRELVPKPKPFKGDRRDTL